MANIDYAGLYFGIDEDIGYTISLYKPDGTSVHFICVGDLFYGTTVGWHEKTGDYIMNHRVRPVLAPANITNDKAMVYPGDKIVHDNSGTWAQDYIEYLVEPYDTFWDSLDIENLPLSEDGELLPEYSEQLKNIAKKGLELIKTKPQGGKSGQEEKPKDKPKQDSPPKDTPKPKPRPPYVLVFIPHGRPYEPPVIGAPPPVWEEGDEPPKGKWRRKRKTAEENLQQIDDTRDCEDFEDITNMVEEAKEAGSDTKARRKHFRYVFVLEKQIWVRSYYADIFFCAGVTNSGQMKILFTFVTAERAPDVPWQVLLGTLASVCGGIDYFIYRDYHGVVEGHLKDAFPKAVFYDSIWSLPADTPIKNRMEEIYRLFDREVNNFWASSGELAATAHLQDAVEKFTNRLIEFFANYHYETEPVELSDLKLNFVQNAKIKTTKQNPAAEEADADVSAPGEAADSPVNYCFVFERQMWLPGGIQQRIAAFNQVTKGKTVKSVIIPLPETIDNSAWEDLISRTAEHLDTIDYILFRGCSVNIFSINKDILPKTVWCSSIADFDMNEEFRAASNEKLNLLENHLSSFGSSGEDIQQCCELLKTHIGLLGIEDIKII